MALAKSSPPTKAEIAEAKRAALQKHVKELEAEPLLKDAPVKPTLYRPYKSATELKKRMQAYFDDCQNARDGEGIFPDEAGMRIFLKMDHASYLSYKDDIEFTKVFDWAMDMRESWLARRLACEPKNAQAYLNALKQPANGGWVDRRADTGDKTLRLKIAGVGGEEAFK